MVAGLTRALRLTVTEFKLTKIEATVKTSTAEPM